MRNSRAGDVLTEPGQIAGRHMDAPPFPVESAFEEDGVEVRIPPGELTREGVANIAALWILAPAAAL